MAGAGESQHAKGKRDRATLGILLGCRLRRREAAELEFAHIQQREDHWAIVDLVGKDRHLIRTVPVPNWVKTAIDSWCRNRRCWRGPRVPVHVCRANETAGTGVTERVVWHVVKNCAKRSGIEKLAPHGRRHAPACVVKLAVSW